MAMVVTVISPTANIIREEQAYLQASPTIMGLENTGVVFMLIVAFFCCCCCPDNSIADRFEVSAIPLSVVLCESGVAVKFERMVKDAHGSCEPAVR